MTTPIVPDIPIKLFPGGQLPQYMTDGAGAMDVFANIPAPTWCTAGGRPTLFPLGFALAIPYGWCARILGRSGMTRAGYFCKPALIDSDFRGEVSVMLWTPDAQDSIKPGQRIAQMYFTLSPRALFRSVAELPPTARGLGGFGSTGK